MEDEGWRMKDGGWRMEEGGWRMEDGGWSVERFYDMCRCLIITSAVYFYLRSIFTAGVPGWCVYGTSVPFGL